MYISTQKSKMVKLSVNIILFMILCFLASAGFERGLIMLVSAKDCEYKFESSTCPIEGIKVCVDECTKITFLKVIARKGGIKSAMTRFWCLGFKFSDSGTGLALAILADIVQDLQASIC
ncbi:hypothetical protein CASFOL_016478 [Castilleja foliolosa]|uniref:Uncharacterized protein n=1 Tax=Castilleja foliolosa TaxID=1961234 RepID=A0ABD3DGQ0_9LAMI